MAGRWRRNVLASILAFTLAACTGGEGSGSTPSSTTGPWRGGTLRVAVDASPPVWWDPAGYTGASPWGLYRCCLLRTLMSYSGRPTIEGGADLQADLASEVPVVSDDGLTWTFHIREGLRYAPPFDDVEIGAVDVVRAIERLATPAALPSRGGNYSFYFDVIDGVAEFAAGSSASIRGLETPDPHTLVVRLTTPTSDLPDRFSLPATAPIPEGVPADRPSDYVRYLVASGPYMFEGSEDLDFSLPPEQQQAVAGFRPMESVVLVRNPSWDPATDDLRAAYVDRIEFTPLRGPGAFVEDMTERREIASTIASRMATGDLDLNTMHLYGVLGEAYERDPDLAARMTTTISPATYYLPMNLGVPPFDDIHVRKAIGLALDRERLFRAFESGDRIGEISWHLAPDATERALLADLRPSWMGGIQGDPDAARAEMRLSRYDHDGDGVCDDPVCRDVRSIDLEQSILPMLRRDLGAIGISFSAEIVPAAEYERLWADAFVPGNRFGTVLAKWWSFAFDYPNGSTVFVPLTHSGALGRPDNANFFLLGASDAQLREWGYTVRSVPSVDDRIERCLSLPGTDQPSCWAALDTYLMEEVVPAIPLFFEIWPTSMSARVERYSWDAAFSYPALDQISLVPGSE